jgi:hypothetical protein
VLVALSIADPFAVASEDWLKVVVFSVAALLAVPASDPRAASAV